MPINENMVQSIVQEVMSISTIKNVAIPIIAAIIAAISYIF